MPLATKQVLFVDDPFIFVCLIPYINSIFIKWLGLLCILCLLNTFTLVVCVLSVLDYLFIFASYKLTDFSGTFFTDYPFIIITFLVAYINSFFKLIMMHQSEKT